MLSSLRKREDGVNEARVWAARPVLSVDIANSLERLVFRIWESTSQLLIEVKGALCHLHSDPGDQSEHIRQLAPVILDYIRMRWKEYPEQGGCVEVAELSLRFRESDRVIKKTLNLLQHQGHAQPTTITNFWEILNPSAKVGQSASSVQGRNPVPAVTPDS